MPWSHLSLRLCLRTTARMLLVAQFALFPASALAQSAGSPPVIVRLSAAIGTVADGCSDCSVIVPRFSGLALGAAVLHPLSRRLAIGVEGLWWHGTYTTYGARRRLLGGAAEVRWQPWPHVPLELEGGLGYFGYRQTLQGSVQEASGAGVEAGVSYALALAPHLTLSPFARYFHMTRRLSTLDGLPSNRLAPHALSIGLALGSR